MCASLFGARFSLCRLFALTCSAPFFLSLLLLLLLLFSVRLCCVNFEGSGPGRLGAAPALPGVVSGMYISSAFYVLVPVHLWSISVVFMLCVFRFLWF